MRQSTTVSVGKPALVWVGPERPDVVLDAVKRGGGLEVEARDANVVVWASVGHDVRVMREILHPGIEWVQVDSAGVDHWLESGLVDNTRIWSSARGRYGVTVAEHAIALLLAGCRGFVRQARLREWEPTETSTLEGKCVAFLGGGSIVRNSIARLKAFDVRCLVVCDPPDEVAGADMIAGPRSLHRILTEADHVVVALPLTPSTRGLVGEAELELIGSSGILVNVGRGGVVSTDALVEVLKRGRLGGAMLDVTEPEPLPNSHPLWHLENVLITSHSANSLRTMNENYAPLVETNVKRFRQGLELENLIDTALGY